MQLESLIYRLSIDSRIVKRNLSEAIKWDLDAVKRSFLSISRFAEMAKSNELGWGEDSDSEGGILRLYESAAKITQRLGQLELYANKEVSNSYVANWLLSNIKTENLTGVWLRLNSTAVLIKGLTDDENQCISLDFLSPEDTEKLRELNREIYKLVELRNSVLPIVDEAVRFAEKQYIQKIMLSKTTVNYDAIEDIVSKEVPTFNVNLDSIENLPSAIEFQDLYRNPNKYLDLDSSITITASPKIVSLVVRPKNKVFIGFSKANLNGLSEDDSDSLISRAEDVFLRQMIATCELTEKEVQDLRQHHLPVLAKNFCSSYKVIATETSVAVLPYGEDQAKIAKMVAISLLREIKEKMPQIYMDLNEMCEAISISTGSVDPRVALGLAYERDRRAATIFSDYPISEACKQKIQVYQSLVADSFGNNQSVSQSIN